MSEHATSETEQRVKSTRFAAQEPNRDLLTRSNAPNYGLKHCTSEARHSTNQATAKNAINRGNGSYHKLFGQRNAETKAEQTPFDRDVGFCPGLRFGHGPPTPPRKVQRDRDS